LKTSLSAFLSDKMNKLDGENNPPFPIDHSLFSASYRSGIHPESSQGRRTYNIFAQAAVLLLTTPITQKNGKKQKERKKMRNEK